MSVSFVPELLVYLKTVMVVEAERIEEETSPEASIDPRIELF